MRLVTLVCFFHFSGLNNGFTYLLDASAANCNMQSTGFAHTAMVKCATALNPLNWKKEASLKSLFMIFKRSGNVLEYASQNAAQNLLFNSIIANVLVIQSAKIKAKNAGLKPARETGFSSSKSPVFQPLNSLAVSYDPLSALEFLDQCRMESWLSAKRLHFLGNDCLNRFSDNKEYEFYLPDKCLRESSYSYSSWETMKRFLTVRAHRPILFRRINAGNSDDDPEPAINAIGHMLKTSLRTFAGMFFFALFDQVRRGTARRAPTNIT